MRRFLMAVDDFYPRPDRVRARALEMSYAEPEDYTGWRTQPHYEPGIRARVEGVLRLPITHWPDDPDEIFSLGHGVFYIGLSTGERAETVGVHFDTPADWVTMVVYLTPGAPPDAGTSLWQHRATGLTAAPTAADARRLKTSVAGLRRIIDRDGRRPDRWREIDRVGNVYNRAVFYHSGVLHSASKHFGGGVAKGRVYQTFRFAVDWNAGRKKS